MFAARGPLLEVGEFMGGCLAVASKFLMDRAPRNPTLFERSVNRWTGSTNVKITRITISDPPNVQSAMDQSLQVAIDEFRKRLSANASCAALVFGRRANNRGQEEGVAVLFAGSRKLSKNLVANLGYEEKIDGSLVRFTGLTLASAQAELQGELSPTEADAVLAGIRRGRERSPPEFRQAAAW